MRLIVGLGNPGSNYEGSRHNAGFKVVELLSKKSGIALRERKFRSVIGAGEISGEEVILAKPLTYMNNSGHAVRAIIDWYGLEPSSLLVIYDDLDLEPGRIRIRPRGSSGGHNGMKSIIDMIGSEEFPRIRIGIGRPLPPGDSVEHVLGWFTAEELPVMREAFERAASAVEVYIERGLDCAMNIYNAV